MRTGGKILIFPRTFSEHDLKYTVLTPAVAPTTQALTFEQDY